LSLQLLWDRIEAQIEARPDALAIAGEGVEWTYRELGMRVRKIAGRLAHLQLGPDDRVALCLERSPELIASILGVLAAGGAYVPIEPALPDQRIRRILDDASPRALLADRASAARLSGSAPEVIAVEPAEMDAWPVAGGVQRGADPRSLAYVIYTSGSTGTPKGVMVEHHSLANLVGWAQRGYGITPTDRVLQFASASVDTSIEEIFPTLASGAALVLRPRALLDSPGDFVRFCAQAELTILNLPTAYWHVLVDGMHRGMALPPCVRRVIVGGEAALPHTVDLWFQVADPRVELLNTYGLTESCAVAAFHRLAAGDATGGSAVPIGLPVDGASLHIVDDRLQPVPDGVVGELCIGGVAVARGYLSRPDLTAERFVDAPEAGTSGARLLRTGDLARRRPDGSVECLGRIDHQVKIRGHRVELGEIEAALAACPGVRQAAVVAREVGAGERRLVAYLAGDDLLPSEDLRELLLLDLPSHMIPGLFVEMDRLPLTRSGKIDRRALPDPPERERREALEPATATEAALARIWAVVLGKGHIGRDANFLALGGHSLSALEVLAGMKSAFGVELPAYVLVESATLSAVAAAVDEALSPAGGIER
jgi:amino acid adenylation domain-containing protein